MVSTSDYEAQRVMACNKLTQDQETHLHDGWPPTVLHACYHIFVLKLAHNLIDCQIWHSVVIIKFFFKQLSSLFEQFIVQEINLDYVATLFRGKTTSNAVCETFHKQE